MKTFTTSLLGLTLLLTLAACGSDEPSDAILYAQIPTLTHVTDKQDHTLTDCKAGGIYAELNVTKKTANVYFPFTMGDKVITIDIPNLPMTEDATNAGYWIKSSAFSTADGHSVSNFEFFVDMRVTNNPRHYLTAIIDGKYEVNALVSTITFENAISKVTPATGDEVNDNKGFFVFKTTSYSDNLKQMMISISGLSVYPLTSGATYTGITFEPTYDGFHITHTADKEPIYPTEGGSFQLKSLDADINVHTRSFTAEYDIQQCGIVTASGNMF